MGMFADYKKAKNHVYDLSNEDVNPNGQERGRYIDHEGDFVLAIRKVKHGISKNKGSKAYNKPFVIFDTEVTRISWQSETAPQTDIAIANGEPGKKTRPVKEGENVNIYFRLPAQTNPQLMGIAEQYQIADLTNAFGALLGVEGAAVDMDTVDTLAEDDGRALKGVEFGVVYTRSVVEQKDDNGDKTGEKVYVNARFYPVDDDGERTEPLTVEQLSEASE